MKPTLRTATEGSALCQTVKIPDSWTILCLLKSAVLVRRLITLLFPLIYSCKLLIYSRKRFNKFCVGSYLLCETVGLISCVSLCMCGETHATLRVTEGHHLWTSSCKKTLLSPNQYNSLGLRIKFQLLNASPALWKQGLLCQSRNLVLLEPFSENVSIPIFFNLKRLS